MPGVLKKVRDVAVAARDRVRSGVTELIKATPPGLGVRSMTKVGEQLKAARQRMPLHKRGITKARELRRR